MDQDAAALNALTGNVLLTDPPGLPTALPGFFYPTTVTPLLGAGGMPGVLIDAIADAEPGGVNVLLNPIDGLPITTDALGNPRVDGNDARNIGAVQLTLAPHLVVGGTSSQKVDLAWSRPLDPSAGGPITGYEVCYGTGTPPDPSTMGTACPGTGPTVIGTPGDPAATDGSVSGLTNGTQYWFLVRGVNPGPGPWSNVPTAIPLGSPGVPSPAAIPGAGAVAVSWAAVSGGGSAVTGYQVLYRPAGTSSWQHFIDTTGLTATVTGLTNGTTYEFGVFATLSSGDVSALGTTQATPGKLAQVPVAGCAMAPKQLPRKGAKRLQKAGCITNAGQRVKVKVNCGPTNRGDLKYCKVIRKKNGKVKIRTFGYKLKIKVTWKAKATSDYTKYKKKRKYKT